MAKQATANTIGGQFNPTEVIAIDPGNALMVGKAFVKERVVSVQ